MIAKLITAILKFLPAKSRASLVTAVINSWNFPTKAIITTDEHRKVLVQGRPLTVEESVRLHESASALQRNPALRLIHDQVRFLAIDNGYLKNVHADPYQELFYKAALWAIQEEKNLIDGLSGQQDSAPL
jgi:hypothetical protein